MSEELKAVIRRVYEDVWNKGDLGIMDELFDADYVLHMPGQEIRGLAAFKEFVSTARAGFPDIHFTIEDQVAEGDKVATRLKATGTHTGEWMGIPPTGKHVTFTDIPIDRFVGGKSVEAWDQADMLGLLQQLGVIPPLE